MSAMYSKMVQENIVKCKHLRNLNKNVLGIPCTVLGIFHKSELLQNLKL